jgi:secretin/TonB-like protein
MRTCAASPLATLTLAGKLALTSMTLVVVAHAGDLSAPVTIRIPAQSLAGALTELAGQADLQILFPQELVRGLRAPALSGNYAPGEALERLLEGANLEFVIRGRDTVIIRALHASQAAGEEL